MKIFIGLTLFGLGIIIPTSTFPIDFSGSQKFWFGCMGGIVMGTGAMILSFTVKIRKD